MLTVHSSEVTYGIPLCSVEEIKRLEQITSIPGSKSYVRGGIWHRDHQIPLIDLRKLFSIPSLREERQQLVQTLDQREKDHLDWIDELYASVKENREFRKTLDPRKCAFGKWYYSFVTYDSHIERLFRAFEAPHAEVHRVGAVVAELVGAGKRDEAFDKINHAKENELAKLFKLFGEFKNALVNDLREISIVVTVGSKKTAIIVDAVENIFKLTSQTHYSEVPEGSSPFISKAVKVKDRSVYLLNIEALFSAGSLDTHTELSAHI